MRSYLHELPLWTCWYSCSSPCQKPILWAKSHGHLCPVLFHQVWLTVERETPARRVLASAVLRHTLVGPGVLLLEIRNFEDGVGVPHLHFGGERNPAGSSPAYFRDRAVTKKESGEIIASQSKWTKHTIRHTRRGSEKNPYSLLFLRNMSVMQFLTHSLFLFFLPFWLWKEISIHTSVSRPTFSTCWW